MPPKKEKKETVKGDEAEQLVLEYLRKQNRPYSAIDVSNNLHNAVTKPAAAKLLKELHERGEIEGRASGKQVVYHVHQNPEDIASAEDMADMATEIASLNESIAALKIEQKSLQATYQQITNLPTSTELQTSLNSLKEEVKNLHIRLDTLQSGNTKPMSAEEKDKMKKSLVMMEKYHKERKKMFREYWSNVKDMLGDMEEKEFWDSTGLEDAQELEDRIAGTLSQG